MTSGNSKPPSVAQTPFFQCTEAIAAAITAASSSAATGTNRPRPSSMPPVSSPSPARNASGSPGSKPTLSKNDAVPFSPWPRNQPNSFCDPWPANKAPTTTRSTSRATFKPLTSFGRSQLVRLLLSCTPGSAHFKPDQASSAGAFGGLLRRRHLSTGSGCERARGRAARRDEHRRPQIYGASSSAVSLPRKYVNGPSGSSQAASAEVGTRSPPSSA